LTLTSDVVITELACSTHRRHGFVLCKCQYIARKQG